MPRQREIDERLVVETWERQAFDPAIMAEIGLEIVFRGLPSDAGGPDYQDAILADHAAGLQQGDVEFHVRSSDWDRHHHHRDPRYNGVILHVVWDHDGHEITCADGHEVPTIELRQVCRRLDLTHDSPPSLAPHACGDVFARLDSADIAASIRAEGWRCFEDRVERFEGQLESLAADQVLYSALLESLGYASNRDAFRRLAEAVTYAWLMCVPPEARGETLLDAAGLGVTARYPPPSRLPLGSWRLSRLRPGNHPALRLRGISRLLERFKPSLATGAVDLVPTCRRPRELRSHLMVSDHAGVAVGAGRADEIAVSVILPFTAAFDPDSRATRDLLARYPSPPSTRWTRNMLTILDGAGPNWRPRSAIDHQGLHRLYTLYCRREGASLCPVCRLVRSAR